MTERQLPEVPDAEKATLGSMLLDSAAIPAAAAELRATDFANDRHRLLFDEIVRLWQAGKPIDGVLLTKQLDSAGKLDQSGGYEYLSELVGVVGSATRVRHYAELVKDSSVKRQAIEAAWRISNRAYAPDATGAAVCDEARQAVDSLLQELADSTEGDSDPFTAFVEHIEHDTGGLLTGFPALDQVLAIQPGNLVVCGGRPGMGKTAFGLGVAVNVAAEQKPVLFQTLEMSRRECVNRLVSAASGVDLAKLTRPYLYGQPRILSDERAAIDEALPDVKSQMKFLTFDEPKSFEFGKLCASIAADVFRRKSALVVIDYVNLIEWQGGLRPKGVSRQEEIGHYSRGLKLLARRLRVPVLLMAQLNRKTHDRKDTKPNLADLRESGNLEQDADSVLFTHREHYYDRTKSEEEADIIVAKQRNGTCSEVQLRWVKQCARFEAMQASETWTPPVTRQSRDNVPF